LQQADIGRLCTQNVFAKVIEVKLLMKIVQNQIGNDEAGSIYGF
jgi:hypothetical protein